MNRTALRGMTATAAFVLALAAPGALGTAAADDRSADPRGWGLSSELQQDAGLVSEIRAAREAYRTSAQSARTAYRTALQGIEREIQLSTASRRAAARTAGDAYRAVLEGAVTGDLERLRSEFSSAWTEYREAQASTVDAAQPAIDTAAGSAKATLMTARSIYASALQAAFAEHAPGVSVPRLLQDPGSWMGMSESRWLGLEPGRDRARQP